MCKVVSILLLILVVIFLSIEYPDTMAGIFIGIVAILVFALFGWFLLKLFGKSY